MVAKNCLLVSNMVVFTIKRDKGSPRVRAVICEYAQGDGAFRRQGPTTAICAVLSAPQAIRRAWTSR